VISREWAVELVKRRLFPDWESGGSAAYDEPFVIAHVEQHELGWYIVDNTRQFVESGDRSYALGGNAPYVVDGLDSSLHRVFPWMCEGFQWAGQYRERVRGEVPPCALDVEAGAPR
jgi:hypothetical protein